MHVKYDYDCNTIELTYFVLLYILGPQVKGENTFRVYLATSLLAKRGGMHLKAVL